MPTLVSTGQITIIDQNDAKPITAFIGSNVAVQQVYTKIDSTTTYIPDWSAVGSPLVLTAYVYVGSTTNIANLLTNKKWSTSLGGTSLGSANTLNISTNLNPDTEPSITYYFEGDYTDSATGLITKILASIVLNVVKTGTNAVYVNIRGGNILQKSNTSTKSVIAIGADLVRSSGFDTSNLEYTWYDGTTDIIKSTLANVGTKYGLKSTTEGTNPTATVSELNTNIPTTNTTTRNTLVISETAVTDLKVYKVDIKDTGENKTYSGFFTVFDTSDPYNITLVSSTGDKLQNGQGSTVIYPRVFNGDKELGSSDATSNEFQSWSFKYEFFEGEGRRAAFIDTNATAQAGGRTITANTAGASNTFTVTFSGSAINVTSGTVVKLVKATGTAEYYEVSANSNSTTITLRYTGFTATNSWLSWTSPPTLNSFLDGKLFICTGDGGTISKTVPSTGITTRTQVIDAIKITVSGDEVDGKGTIVCEASRP